MLRKRKKEGPGEINAGSMADIAFLLLIFFLVTTTMDTDAGILRLLPPIVEEEIKMDVRDRDVYVVLINDADMLLVEGEQMDIKDLREGTKEFFKNPDDLLNLPEKTWVTASICAEKIAQFKSWVANETDPELKENYQKQLERWEEKQSAVKLLGDFKELHPNAVVSLQTGSKTSYDMYVRVQNELEAAVRELREELAKEKFGRKFSELDDKNEDDQPLILAVRMVFPQRISEAEPVEVGLSN